MWLKNTSRNDVIVAGSIGIYLGIVIWITLLCREPAYTCRVIMPFESYRKIYSGDYKSLVENIENIVMFFPLGYYLQMHFQKDWKQIAVKAFIFSLSIELVQLITTRGCFEVDDMLHNVEGAIIGALLFKLVPYTIGMKAVREVKVIITLFLFTLCFLLARDYYKEYTQYKTMLSYAALNNKNGQINYFVPSGEDGYCWNTDVYIHYLEDGSISISGESNRRSWFELGSVELESGLYRFEGLTGVAMDTVDLEFEYYDKNLHRYISFISDIGNKEYQVFQLTETTKVRGLIGVYPGCNCNVKARPAIYRLGE